MSEKMKLRHITCSDPREHNPIKTIINLAHLPHAEIAVQCHQSKMSAGMPRNVWFNQLICEALQASRVNLAIHINAEWAYDICARGHIPDIILAWLKIEKSHGRPLIKRTQLNLSKDAADNIDVNALNYIFRYFPHTEFIFQYNDDTKDAIEKVHKSGAKFSVLIDGSRGNGISPDQWPKPIYAEHPIGYGGGMSPYNVIGNLYEIEKVAYGREIWIDAEGKLKSQNLFDEKALFDADLAKAYIDRANKWIKMR